MSASAPGSAPHGHAARPPKAIPRSRAYWELKAEQMMNRIFDPVEPIDLEVEPAPGEAPAPVDPAPLPQVPMRQASAPVRPAAADSLSDGSAAGTPDPLSPARLSDPGTDVAPAATPRSGSSAAMASASGVGAPAPRRRQRSIPGRGLAAITAATAPSRPRRPDDRLLLIGALCGVCLASLVGSLLYFGHWTRLQQSITQERNLLLLERLRSLGPANPSPVQGPDPVAPALPAPVMPSAAGAEGLPPPPPQEAWIEQLSSLPETPPASPRVLTVPVSPRLAAAAPPARASASTPPPQAAAAPLPQLVGVVAGAGRAASAIFLVGGSSMSVSSGEQIGATGWRLRSAEGETALIERGGELRQVSIASGNGF